MTDPKPKPSADNVERARTYVDEYVCEGFGVEDREDMSLEIDGLAKQFAASDAIARRMAIEEAERVCSEVRDDSRMPGEYALAYREGAIECWRRIALLRAPTSEKADQVKRAVAFEEKHGSGPPAGRFESQAPPLHQCGLFSSEHCGCSLCGVNGCKACSPPADGGG